jgi:membrane-associated phospholipid phosphatase
MASGGPARASGESALASGELARAVDGPARRWRSGERDAGGSERGARGGRWLVRGAEGLARADRAVFAAVAARRRPAVIAAARAVSGLAEPAVVYPVLAAAGLVGARRAGWARAALPCLVVAGGAAARRQLSVIIARPRPPASEWLTEPEGFSLPSRHTTLAALAAGAAARALGAGGAPLRAAPLLAAAGVGASRVCLGVHWPGDVLAGWIFAEAWLLLADHLPTDRLLTGHGRAVTGSGR